MGTNDEVSLIATTAPLKIDPVQFLLWWLTLFLRKVSLIANCSAKSSTAKVPLSVREGRQRGCVWLNVAVKLVCFASYESHGWGMMNKAFGSRCFLYQSAYLIHFAIQLELQPPGWVGTWWWRKESCRWREWREAGKDFMPVRLGCLCCNPRCAGCTKDCD